jgi:hypothetical protein
MTIAKALTALVMTGLIALLGGLGITPDTPLVSVIEILVTAAAVYYIPNKGKDPVTE